MSDILEVFAQLIKRAEQDRYIISDDNPDLRQIEQVLIPWSTKVVPLYGLHDEKSIRVLTTLFEITYCLGFAAGKKATALSNWRVANEEEATKG